MNKNYILDANLSNPNGLKPFKYPRKIRWFWNINFFLQFLLLLMMGITRWPFLVNFIITAAITYRIAALNKRKTEVWALIYLSSLTIYFLAQFIIRVYSYTEALSNQYTQTIYEPMILLLGFPISLVFFGIGCIFHLQFWYKKKYGS